MGLGTKSCAGQERRGRAGQRGAARAATREGARREGAEAQRPSGGAGRRGTVGRAAATEGPWDSHEGLRGGDGEESGQQGPGGAGVLTSLRGRRPLPGARRAVRGSGSRRAGPASLSPPPTGPSPAPPARSPRGARGPGHSLCKRRPSKALGSLPNRRAYLGTGPLFSLGGRERGRNRAGGQDKEAEIERRWGRGEPERKGERCGGLLCCSSPSRQRGKEEKGRGLSPQGTSPRPSGVAGPWCSVNAGTECGIKKSQMAPAWKGGREGERNFSAVQRSDLWEWGRGPAEESPSAFPSPRARPKFLPRDEGQQGYISIPKPG